MNIKPYLLFAFIIIALPCASVAEQSAANQKTFSAEQYKAKLKAQTEQYAASLKTQTEQYNARLKAQTEQYNASQKAYTEKYATAASVISDKIYSYLKTGLQILPPFVKLVQNGVTTLENSPSGLSVFGDMGITTIEQSPELNKVFIPLTASQKRQIDDAVWECQNTPMKEVLYRTRGYVGLQVEVLRKLILDEAARQGVTCQP
jgi:hypothetical protein